MMHLPCNSLEPIEDDSMDWTAARRGEQHRARSAVSMSAPMSTRGVQHAPGDNTCASETPGATPHAAP
eukprot:4984418-Alexandrium_andersonii.AAC.1